MKFLDCAYLFVSFAPSKKIAQINKYISSQMELCCAVPVLCAAVSSLLNMYMII